MDSANFMIKILLGVGLLGLLTSSAFSGLVIAGLWRFLARRRAARPAFLPPVSLFKPLYGAEPNLEAHLETFFQQDYPEFEIIFGARVSPMRDCRLPGGLRHVTRRFRSGSC